MSDKDEHENHVENIPLMEEFPDFVQTDNAVVVRVNSTRLETYLKAIKNKLRNHDVSLLNQVDCLDRASKTNEIRISKLAVRLDHCLQDVHNFKDLVLGKLKSDKEGVNEKNLYSHEITYLQSQVTSLSAMMRKIELSQSEGMESFCQIKQLNESLKTVMRQLDSLGKNSVILELKQNFDKCINALQSEIKTITAKQGDIEVETNERMQVLETENLSALDQRIALLEEKSTLYDMILNEQEENEQASESAAAAAETTEEHDPTASEVLIQEGEEKHETEIITAETNKPLRPSEMLLLNQDQGDSEDEGSPSREEDEAGALAAAPTGRKDQLSALGGPRASTLELIQNLAPSPGFRSIRSASAKVQHTSAMPIRAAAESSDNTPAVVAEEDAVALENNQPFLAVTRTSLAGPTNISRKNGTTRGSISRKNGTTRGSLLKTSNFFTNLMGEYVNRDEFTNTVQEISNYTRKSICRLKQQLSTHGIYLLFTILIHIQKNFLKWKYKNAFENLKKNVQSWHIIRNRRNYVRASKFQTKMQYICSGYMKKHHFHYWARMTALFKERDRLKLWLRNVLQHWINMRVINIRIYMNRWKRSTVHSYYSSLFIQEEGENGNGAESLTVLDISDDFRRLLESDNFSVREVKRIAHEDMRRRWAYRERQERLHAQQEAAIKEQVSQLTLSIATGSFPVLGGSSVKSEEVDALQSKVVDMEEGLMQLRLDVRRIFSSLDTSSSEIDAKIEAEGRRITSEFNIYRSQVALRFNDAKESLVVLQADVKAQFDSENKRIEQLEERLQMIDQHLEGEQNRVEPLIAEQQRMQSVLDALKSELRITDTQIDVLSGKIDRAVAASTATVDSNQRMERVLTENAEYYDVELKFMRTHVTETMAALEEMKAQKQEFVQRVDHQMKAMLQDLNTYVERLPPGSELLEICHQYEIMWVRLHYEGAEGSAELKTLPDRLHNQVAQVALRIAHHIATAADRLVLSRWTGASTGKKAAQNPQEAPYAYQRATAGTTTSSSNNVRKSSVLVATAPTHPAATVPETTDCQQEGVYLGEGVQVDTSWHMPTVDLVEQVREELLQNYLDTGLIALLRQEDSACGPPGLLKSTGRATFQRKLKRAVESALSKYVIMTNPLQMHNAAALAVGRVQNPVQGGGRPHSAQLDNRRTLAYLNTAPTGETITTTTIPTASSAAAYAVAVETPRDVSDTPRSIESVAAADSAGGRTTRDEIYRPDSPLSQISVSMTKKGTAIPYIASFGETLESVPRFKQTNLEEPTAEFRINKIRPASASAVTRHRDAVRHSQQQQQLMQNSSINQRTVGRETTVGKTMLHSSSSGPWSSGTPVPMKNIGNRRAAGFEVPLAMSGQASEQLAKQLAGQFQQDASFQGAAARKADASDALAPLQMSRKLYGVHSNAK